MADPREVHILDDNNYPEGPVLCGKTSTDVLGDKLRKTDRLCNKCAMALLERHNEYADETDILRQELVREQVLRRELRTKLLRSDRMLMELLERYLDVPPVD